MWEREGRRETGHDKEGDEDPDGRRCLERAKAGRRKAGGLSLRHRARIAIMNMEQAALGPFTGYPLAQGA